MSRDGLDNHNLMQGTLEGPSVLVVDDNPLIVEVIARLLRAQSYQVFACGDGEDAWGLLKQQRIDVIICDVMMPRMGGYELFETLRADPQYSYIPFVFLTALDDPNEVGRGKEVGADDYLCKPFEPAELLAVVKGKLVRSRVLREQSEKRFDDYRRRIIHTLSHEFRTPLVAVNAGVELLLEHRDALDSDKARSLLDAVKRGGARLEKLVGDFMILQQIEGGLAAKLFESRASLCVLTKIVEGYLRIRRETFEQQGAVVVFVDHSEGALVRIVETQIADCIERLVSNAIKFSGKGQAIELELAKLDDWVRFTVKDRGIGLDMSKLNEAIHVFGQINREKLEQQGGGFGLAIATQYAAINQGRLDFELRPGGGTMVTLILPTAVS